MVSDTTRLPGLAGLAVVSSGLPARAICAVREGTCSPERERRDDAQPDSYIGLRNSTEHAR